MTTDVQSARYSFQEPKTKFLLLWDVGRSLLLGFASTVIPSFSLLEMNVFRNGGLLLDEGGTDLSMQVLRLLYLHSAGIYSRCRGVQVTIDSVHPLSPRFCARYTEGFCQCRLMQQVVL
jgi:hypothetical protein